MSSAAGGDLLGAALAAWRPDPVVLLPLLLLGSVYAAGQIRLARRGRRRTMPKEAWLFVAAYFTLVIVLVSPLHVAGEMAFAPHMVQHLLLTLVAAPLLLLARTLPVMLWGLPSRERSGAAALMGGHGPVGRVLRRLAHPLVAWPLFVVGQWTWHQPWAYQLALHDEVAHYAEHVTFFVTALLLWWPVIGAPPVPSPLPYPMRILYAFVAWIPNSLLGAGIALAPALLFPLYQESARTLGIDPLADQQLAGLIMWVPGDLVFLVVLLLVLGAWMRSEERSAERIDRELDARDEARRRAV